MATLGFPRILDEGAARASARTRDPLDARIDSLRRQLGILEAAMLGMGVAPILLTLVAEIHEAVEVLAEAAGGARPGSF